jgi:hypothetical protein
MLERQQKAKGRAEGTTSAVDEEETAGKKGGDDNKDNTQNK